MGENPAQTVKEIDETRARLDRELDELERRLPGQRVLRRALRLAFGGGIGSALFWMAARRLVRPRRPAAIQSPPPPPPVEIHLLPDRWAETLESREAQRFALFAAGAWLGFKLMERRRAA